jgi:hypothetical protein
MGAAEHGAKFPMAKQVRQSMTHQQLHDFALGSMKGKPTHVAPPKVSHPKPVTAKRMTALDASSYQSKGSQLRNFASAPAKAFPPVKSKKRG